MMSPKETNKDEKMQELILHIALRSENDPNYGATKLNKILFYSDFRAYLYLGKSITEQEYQKLPNGPAPRRLVPVRDKMKQDGEIAIRTEPSGIYRQNRIIALRPPNLRLFTAEEIAIVDQVISEAGDLNADQISEYSHEFIGWEMVELGNTIDYEVALVDIQGDLTPEEIQHGKSLQSIAQKKLASA